MQRRRYRSAFIRALVLWYASLYSCGCKNMDDTDSMDVDVDRIVAPNRSFGFFRQRIRRDRWPAQTRSTLCGIYSASRRLSSFRVARHDVTSRCCRDVILCYRNRAIRYRIKRVAAAASQQQPTLSWRQQQRPIHLICLKPCTGTTRTYRNNDKYNS